MRRWGELCEPFAGSPRGEKRSEILMDPEPDLVFLCGWRRASGSTWGTAATAVFAPQGRGPTPFQNLLKVPDFRRDPFSGREQGIAGWLKIKAKDSRLLRIRP